MDCPNCHGQMDRDTRKGIRAILFRCLSCHWVQEEDPETGVVTEQGGIVTDPGWEFLRVKDGWMNYGLKPFLVYTLKGRRTVPTAYFSTGRSPREAVLRLLSMGVGGPSGHRVVKVIEPFQGGILKVTV